MKHFESVCAFYINPEWSILTLGVHVCEIAVSLHDSETFRSFQCLRHEKGSCLAICKNDPI